MEGPEGAEGSGQGVELEEGWFRALTLRDRQLSLQQQVLAPRGTAAGHGRVLEHRGSGPLLEV